MSELNSSFELSIEFRELLEQAVERKDAAFVKETMEGVNPADISALLDEVDSEIAKYVIDVLHNEVGAEIIEELEDDTRNKFLEMFESGELADYLSEMESDDAVDIINDLPVRKREEVIAQIEDEEMAAHILELMRYDEDCAGGLMAKEMIVANENWTILQTIDEIRRQRENVDKIYSIYVVDDRYKLVGKVSVKKIILANDNTHIKDIYDDDIQSVETYMDEEDVADIMQKYDLDAIPVVNLQGKLVGRITIDDVVDVITEQAEEDMQLMSGIATDVEEDDSIWALSKARLPWLLIGLVGGTLGAWAIGFFEGDLDRNASLAFFIPLVMATGGNVGIQSSTLVVQSLANKSAFDDSFAKRVGKMLLVALLTGIVLAGISFLIVYLWKGDSDLGKVVGISLIGVVMLSSFMGTTTPLVLDKFGINPALASGPFITTTNDILGIIVYLAMANLLLPHQMMKKCLIADEMHESIFSLMEGIGFEVSYRPEIGREELLNIIADYQVLLIRSKTDIDAEVVDAARKLEVIGRAGAGLDKIDVAYVEARGIEIINAPEGNRDALAEHVMGLLLAMLNNIISADAEVRQWIWNREANRGMELSDKTIGIIGYGNMGQAFVQRLRAFDCRILVYDKYKKGFGTKKVEEVSLEKIYEKADILSLHVPLTEETRRWVNKDFIGRFRKDIYLINSARGEVLPVKDLLALLDSGKVRGAALDVLEKEKFDKLTDEEKCLFTDLFERRNVVFSPHVGGWTFASYKRINEVLVGKIAAHYRIESDS